MHRASGSGARREGGRLAIPVNVADEDLDEYIAEMILSDARAKELAYERRNSGTCTRYVASLTQCQGAYTHQQAVSGVDDPQRRLA